MGNQYTTGTVSVADRIERMKKRLNSFYPELEYVSGFTGSEGKIVVKYKRCGHVKEVSLISVRHKDVSKECRICYEEQIKKRKEQEKEQKHKLIEYESFKRSIKPRKIVQTSFVECKMCGKLFFSNNIRNCYCSKECKLAQERQYANRRKDFRKRISRTSESSSITLNKLFKRDKGICWLCGKPCDYGLDGNDDLYPSIDHVIPIAKGGKDCWENVKLAHRKCNSLKRDRIIASPTLLKIGYCLSTDVPTSKIPI